ncbi:MAG TPA: chromate resistance protein ChrB domain-containing protein [Candidatus Saccharimonadia bacterium]|nr:chromate resistance protein ChrB domain-containing protein [Candidatus Saccharimonadia bacterium]
MKLLVTHATPDIDAIASVWLLKRFEGEHFADAKVVFVRAGGSLSKEEQDRLGFGGFEAIHVDTGSGEFDHHQAERGMTRTCATELVYKHLAAKHPEVKNNWALQQIVEYVLIDDHFEDYFWPDAASERYLFTLRSILHGHEYLQLHDDDEQLNFGMKCLDGIFASLKERRNAMDIFADGKQFDTIWGRAIAFETPNQSVLRYAQLRGFNLVIQRDPKIGNVRIKAAPRPEIDLTQLHKKVLEADTKGTWFFHEGRHMLLNTWRKGGKDVPTPLTLDQVIAIAKSCTKT